MGLQNELLNKPSQDKIIIEGYLVLKDKYTCTGLLRTIPEYTKY